MSRVLKRLGASGWRYPLLICLFLSTIFPARAQQLLNYQYINGFTQALLTQQRYRVLDSVGRAALMQGSDYPALRRRLGASALATDHPAAALRYYGPALHENPLDDDARAGLASAYLALNQTGAAALLAGALPPEIRRALGLPHAQAVAQLEVEGSVQTTTERRRGNGFYQRLGVSSCLGARLSLLQNLSYYGQTIELPTFRSPSVVESYRISQGQYHALLTAQLAPRWQAKAGYDYLTRYLGSNHLGYLALAYARPVWVAQAGGYAGVVTDTARTQLGLRLTVYPLGNLRLYGFGRGSVVRPAGRSYPNGLLGAGGCGPGCGPRPGAAPAPCPCWPKPIAPTSTICSTRWVAAPPPVCLSWPPALAAAADIQRRAAPYCAD
jgi:hypothetical protein